MFLVVGHILCMQSPSERMNDRTKNNRDDTVFSCSGLFRVEFEATVLSSYIETIGGLSQLLHNRLKRVQ